MSQTFDSTKPISGTTTFGELYQVIRDHFDAMRSAFSGTSAPASPVGGQKWWDSNNHALYVYNDGTSSWTEIAIGSSGIGAEVADARGTKSSLDERLDVALNEDGTLKSTVSAYQSEWIDPGFSITYISATQFRVSGDQTDIYTTGRRLKINQTTDAYTEVSSSAYSSPNTTITVIDSVISSGVSSVEHSILHSDTSISALPYSYTAAARRIPRADSSGKLDSGWIPSSSAAAHASTHELGGSDVISFADLAPLFHVEDHKSSGSGGGSFVNGAWRTRDLNTVIKNDISSASLSSNQIILPAGTFRIEASAPAVYVGYNAARLYNITDSSVILSGTSNYGHPTAYGAVVHSFINGVFTLTASKTLQLQHRCGTSYSNGFGLAAGTSFTVGTEIYSIVKIIQIA